MDVHVDEEVGVVLTAFVTRNVELGGVLRCDAAPEVEL